MTNEELIAQARELVENQVAYFNRRCEEIPLLASIRDEEMWQLTASINSWKTHLAEMDEHEGIHTPAGYVCKYCSPWRSFEGGQVEYPCNFLVTKAKRLLEVGENE